MNFWVASTFWIDEFTNQLMSVDEFTNLGDFQTLWFRVFYGGFIT
jgi:hypothetical protein